MILMVKCYARGRCPMKASQQLGVKMMTLWWNQVWCCKTTSLPAATDHHPHAGRMQRLHRGG